MDTAYNKATKAYGNQDYENNSSSNQNKLKPSQLLSKQLSGNVMEELNHKPRIIQFLNLGDFSSYTSSAVSIDEPLFEPSPSIIQFTDYEPLQIKDKIFRLRNKDRYARRVKIIPPDSRLFQVLPYHKSKKADIEDDESLFAGSKVAPGMEISFIVRFSPEAKIDYSFNLIVVTEREKFEVPIIATGKRAMIDFPDVLDFEKCPVKYCTEKPIVIRNVGEKTTRWFLQLPAPFDANKKEGFLEKGHGEQIIVTFTPSESKEYNLEAIFSYDNLNSYVVCRGKAENDDVGLSKRSIIMDEAYIGLQTQQTLQIVNKSNVRVDFQWRAFAFEKEELDKKNKLKHQLDQEEAEERILIKEMATSELVNTDYGIDDDNESEDEERDEQTMIVKKQKKAEMLLARKYKNIRKAIEDDQLLFQDDIFTIEPTSGQIWPNSAMTVTVAFKPLAALSYSCTAFCNISCKEERLVLNLAGEGIGPKAVITPQDDIDLGDVTITAIKTKDFTIENRGEIPATFQLLLPDTPAAKMFKFDVDRGILGVGERLNFTVTFQSEMLGEFSETFRFRLEGSTELIPLRFRGHVIGPSFRFDRNEIDFGEVSYSFPKEEYINLINTSPVSFRFSLRIPGDIPDRREFEIQPSRDVINKGEQRSIKVIFTPQAVKKYEMNLKIDILNVGEGLYSIPIFAESSVPTVKVFPPEIIFEKAYLRHKEERELRIINESNLPAKFDVAPQSKESEVLAAYTVNKQSGVIQPMKEEIIKVTLETRKLREIRLPIAIHVVGNTNLPFIVNIIANSIGPDVDISEKEIDFGNIEVLRDWTKTLKVKNNSPIKADFHVFTKTKNSIFKPLQKHGVLERYSAIDIPVLCTPDDTGNFNDILHFVITEGVDIDIPLRAKGTGSTIYSKEDLKNISFGLAYTFKYDHREIFVENKGRRPQKLSWQPKKPYEGKNKKDKQAQTAEKPKSDQPEEEPESVYTVVPDSVLLPPKSGVMFQFRAYSSRVGNVTEFYQLFTQVGNDRKQNLLLDSTLSGEFINPTLSFSEAKMHFKYTWERGVPYSLISRNLEITNVTQLPTNFHIKVAPPFSINKEHFSLIPGRSAIVKVDFDPSLKGDRVSGLTRNKLQLMHVDHPHRDYINLIGEVCFPNLKLETNLINFGSIMSETNKTIAMTIQNVGEMALNYNWSFLENQILRERDEEGFENISRQSLRMKEKEIYSVNDIFDILPTNGTLQPNEIQKIEFQFNALLGQKVKATAIVTAEGGPDYPVQLVGDSSEMTYKLLHKTLDYGVQPFNEWETKDVILENTGKVSFEFKVNLSTIIRKGLIEVTPSSGLLKGFEKLKLHVKMCPGYPDIVDEHFFIEIAHFEPEKITIKGSAIYPAVVMDLPRHDNNDFLRNLEGEPEELKSEERSSGVEETKMSDIDRPVISKAEVEADRRTFVEYINKNLNEKKVLALRTMESFQSPPSNKFSSAIKNLRNEPVSASPGLKNSARSFRGSENFGVVSPTALTARERGDEIVKASVLKEVTSPLAKNMGVSRSLAFLAEDKSQIIDDKSMAMTKNTFKLPGMAGGSNKLLDPKVYSRITLASFICDLENIVLGASKKKTFKITNVSSMPVTFHFDQKVYKLLNMTIVPERVAKLDPDETVSVTVTYQTKKNQKFGRNKMVIPIEVKNGPKINLEVLANITIPEIWFEHENIDFQKAIIGQKKIVYMRFENNKEVTVDWAMSTRADLSSGNDKDGLRFSMSPTSGIIKPGQKQMIEFTFIPLSEKTYNHKFIINIRDNPKVTIIQTRGTGASVSLDFIPEKLSIGPALPYDNKVLVRLDVRNPSDYDTELYSLNYDATYLQEEEMLRAYEELSGHPEGLSVPVRFPGQPFWPRIRKAWEIKQKRLEYNRKMKEINAQPQVDLVAKEALQKEIDEFNLANQLGEEVPPPRKVKDELKHHVIVFGPPGCGKTQLAKHMSTTHQRGLVKMDELLEWNRQNNTSAVELADRHLEERKKVYEQVFQEYEKMKKKKKKGEEDIPPNIQDYEYLTEDIIVALLEERLKSPDCNAGIVFDNISNKLYAKELEGVRAILRVLPSQHVQLVNLYYPVDASGLEVSEIVDPAKELISHALPIMANVSTLSRNASQFHSPDEDRRKKSKLSQSTTSKKVKRTDTAQKLITQSDHGAIDNTFTFEVQYPKQLAPEELEQYKAKAKDLLDLVLGQYKEPPPPVVEEVKKDDKSKDTKKTGKKDGKKEEEKPVEVVEVHEEPKIPIPNKTLVANNNRSVISLPIIYNYQQLNQTVMAVVPEPQFPDPDLEPVPVPANFQLLRKPAIRHAPEVSKTFTILTPKDNYINETDTDIIMLDRPLEETTTFQQMRWIIPAKKKISLYVKFFTHTPGYYESVFDFESFYSTKQYKVPCAALCDFPTINSKAINVFMQRKKFRPAHPPDCYVSKHYIMSEKVFDFGPLLVGKNSTKRNENNLIYMNSSIFRITNNGKFDADIDLTLASSVFEGPEYKKGTFIFEPEKFTLAVDQTEDLRVWAFPEAPQLYKDQIICMIKNNPVPVIFDVQCTGVKPIVEVDVNTVKFERLLLNQSSTERLKLKNVCAVPVRWSLKGVDKLPEEFTIKQTEGLLRPTEEKVVEITFRAIKQEKFNYSLELDVEDNEKIGIKQAPIEIKLQAEAFDINVSLDPHNTENMLNFGDVRVGDLKEQKFPIKNIGLYDIKCRFVMKKKLFRENFTIEPSETIIEPNQEKVITFKFCSKEEVKLKTTSSTTDIVLEILEGKSLEIFNKLMVNVTVNAVFSKYSIAPQKSINFGPIQFDEPRSRQFEIKNEGIFEFNYTIFDYSDDARRNEILKLEQPEKEEEKAGGKDAKKKTEPPKPAKKDPKKDKDLGTDLRIGPWSIDPPTGSIAPDSSQTIKVTFKGVGQKLCEQKLGIHISRRDPHDQPLGILHEVVAESCIPGINTEHYDSIFEEQIVIPSLTGSQNVQEQINSNVFAIEEKTFYFGTMVPSKHPNGIQEQFKITNPGKIPCNVKFDVKKRSSSTNELFAFKVKPSSVSIMPHHYKYVTVSFEPETIASYGGLFEAIVEYGEQNPRTGKLVFDLRGECALPSLKVERPKEWMDDRTPILRFPKVRVDKAQTLPIILKNDGQIPATVEFDIKPNESFRFLDQSTFTISAKTSATFNIEFKPREPGQKRWELIAKTHDNPYENPKIVIVGEGYQEHVIFDKLPNDLTDEINFGDCVVNTEKQISFKVKNNGNTPIRFNWETGNNQFTMIPKIGHIAAYETKDVTCVFKPSATVTYKDLQLVCQAQGINRDHFTDWDNSMTVTRFVTKSEYDWFIKKKEEEERKQREEEEEAKTRKGAKKDTKKVGSKVATTVQELDQDVPPVVPGEIADTRLEVPIPEPAYQPIEKTEKNVILKANSVADYVKYECETKEIMFAPTLMFTSRTYSLSLKNTSLIQMRYSCKLVSAETGQYDAGYYHLNPKSGVINPGCDESINIRFSPKEVEESNARLLVISIDNLDPSLSKLIVELDGETERPVCHFELPPPLLRDKRAQDLAQEAKYHIIEFESLGTKVKNAKRFYVINPTNQGYEFEWTKDVEEPGKSTHSNFFRCLTPKGTVLSGKKYEMIFEYLPDIEGKHESYWTFSIPGEKIKHHFAVIGTVTEPNVLLEVGSVNFGPLLLGGKNKEIVKLKNLEHIPFTFSFDRESVKGDPEYGDSLVVHPMSGVINPDSEIPIEVTFQPRYEKSYNYNLLLNIKQKTRYVNLNVKGHGYNLHHTVALSSTPEPLSHHVDHLLDFGDIFINEKKSKIITITNSGDFNFDFSVKKSQFSYITINPENANVLKNEKVNIEVTFAPISEYKLNPKPHYFNLQIVSGPTYHFRLAGSARKPNVEFSFIEHDFGPCYVLKQPLPRTALLEIRNLDTSAMSIETLFEKTNYLDVQLAPGQVILPSTKPNENILRVPIVFNPRELVKYEDTVEFDINGLHKIGVAITGEGTPLKLDLEKSEDTSVDFGIQRIGTDVTKTARLINYGRRAIALTFDFNNQLENLLDKYAISVYPNKEFVINPREGIEVEIRFNPRSRLHQFKHELVYQIVDNKENHKLLNVIGCCHGIELKLMQDTIGFGSVVVNSKLTREVQVVNLGDVRAKFNWDTTYCGRYYTITPVSGVIPAHEDIKFSVTFHPDVVDNDISFRNVKCSIEGSLPLYMNLFGKGIPQTRESIQEVKFQTKVRTTEKKKVLIKNPTDIPWKIKAAISSHLDTINGYFFGNDTIEVPKNGQAEYEISYHPLSMTKNDKAPQIKEERHEASLFFPTPDGSALLFNLVGEALPPPEAGSFTLNVKTKKSEVQVIPVKNWVKAAQRFAVTWEVVGGDPTILLKGANTIDVSGDSVKEYKLSVISLKPGNARAIITFKNEQTGEYMVYGLAINSSPPDILRTFELTSPVRETITKVITLENPLLKPVHIAPEHLFCDSDAIAFNPTSFTIEAQSEFGLEVMFRPLVVGEKTCNVIIKSPDLGDFPYKLKLHGTPSMAQRSMTFKTPLGTDLVQKFKFTHYLKKQTVYSIKIERVGPSQTISTGAKDKAIPNQVDFIAETQTVTVPPADSYEGIDHEINIRYEPSKLGDSKAILTVSSPEGGEYQCNLNGQGSPPVSKGPIKVGSKGQVVEFKNPFFEAAEFAIRIDNPSFTTSTKSPALTQGKNVLKIPVNFKSVPDALPTGRIIISTGDIPAWIYYLQGE